jgi:hypothetical protein
VLEQLDEQLKQVPRTLERAIGRLFGVSVSNSMKLPLPGFILPILDVPLSQNQRCWSGPNTMMYGLLCGVGIGCKTISTSVIDSKP